MSDVEIIARIKERESLYRKRINECNDEKLKKELGLQHSAILSLMNDLKIGVDEELENNESIFIEIPCLPGTTVYVMEFYGVREYIVDSFSVENSENGGLVICAKDAKGYKIGNMSETVFLSEKAAERKIIDRISGMRHIYGR